MALERSFFLAKWWKYLGETCIVKENKFKMYINSGIVMYQIEDGLLKIETTFGNDIV